MQNHIVLASLRAKNKLTQNELADVLKISLSTYKLYEFGTLPMSLEELNTLSNFYNVSLDYLLGLSKKPYVEHIKNKINYRYLSFAIRYLRKRDKITQAALAEEFGISKNSICKYEKDPTKINLNYLTLMTEKFHISSDYLCGRSLKKEVL